MTLPKGWELKKISDLATPVKVSGVVGKDSYLEIGDIDVTTKKYIIKEKKSIKGCKKAYENNIVISRVRPTRGAVSIINEEEIEVSSAFTILKSKDIIKPKLLFYLVAYNPHFYLHLEKLQKGSSYPSCREKDITEFEILIPTEFELQEKIIALLEKAEQIKNWRKEADDLSKDYLKSVFVDMFGDPVKDQNKFVKMPLSKVVIVNPKKSELDKTQEIPVSFLTMSDVGENGEIFSEKTKFIQEVFNGFTYFRKGDVLFAKITPCMENGKGAIANIKNDIGFGSTEFHVLRPTDKSTSEWIYYLLSFPNIRLNAEKKMTGSAGQKRVPTGWFDILEIPIPDYEEQKRFSKIAKSFNLIIEEQKKAIKDSEKLFNSLMQKAFKGEIKC